jgi:hypothetical protein
MGKCQAVTDGFPCGQQDDGDTELCFYHHKMLKGLIMPFRGKDILVSYKGMRLNLKDPS